MLHCGYSSGTRQGTADVGPLKTWLLEAYASPIGAQRLNVNSASPTELKDYARWMNYKLIHGDIHAFLAEMAALAERFA